MAHSKEKSLLYSSNKRSLYLGQVTPLYTRVNVSPTLVLSIEQDVKLIDPLKNKTYSGKSFLIPAGEKLVLDTNYSHISMCSLDEFGNDFSKLIPKMDSRHTLSTGNNVYSGISYEAELIKSVENIWLTRASAEDALQDFDSWVNFFAKGCKSDYKPDKRVIDAVTFIQDNCCENTSVEHIASNVHISASRLTQLFKKVIGSPIRRFRLWQRIKFSVLQIHAGVPMTDAAISAGFSDYPQFSRVFKELWGANPVAAKNNTEIRVAC
jgi:AraC-like DNA-binding protein